MPIADDRFMPDEELLKKFIVGFLNPKIDELASEGVELDPIEIIVVESSREEVVKKDDRKRSVCKVAFYNTYTPDRYLIKSCVRLLERQPVSGFTGLNLTGDIKMGVPKMKGCTLVYNELKFGKV